MSVGDGVFVIIQLLGILIRVGTTNNTKHFQKTQLRMLYMVNANLFIFPLKHRELGRNKTFIWVISVIMDVVWVLEQMNSLQDHKQGNVRK